jgi:hypothetical protein
MLLMYVGTKKESRLTLASAELKTDDDIFDERQECEGPDDGRDTTDHVLFARRTVGDRPNTVEHVQGRGTNVRVDDACGRKFISIHSWKPTMSSK